MTVSETNKRTLSDHMGRWKTEIMANYRRAGGTKQGFLELNVGADSGTLKAPKYITAMEEGRGPRTSTSHSGLQGLIYAWMARKGLFKSGEVNARQREATRMTWYINKYGTRLYQLIKAGGSKREIYSNVLSQANIDLLVKDLGDKQTVAITSELMKQFQ